MGASAVPADTQIVLAGRTYTNPVTTELHQKRYQTFRIIDIPLKLAMKSRHVISTIIFESSWDTIGFRTSVSTKT
jgi:hypothetical protein